MSENPSPAPLSDTAQAVADSKLSPGDEYEEIREQVSLLDRLGEDDHLKCRFSCLAFLSGPLPADRQHCSNNEEYAPRECQDRQGLQGNSPGMCVGVHFVYYIGSE